VNATAISRRSKREATPRQGDRRERAILEAARTLLGRASLAELTVGRIAKEAGVPRSSLYFYFADKVQIFEVLLAGVLEEMSGGLERWFADPENLSEAWLRASVAGAVEIARQNAAVVRAAADNRGAHAGIDLVCEVYFERSVARATALIERDREAGLAPLGGPPAQAIARALMHMTERSIYDLLHAGAGDAQAAALVDTLTVLWARGVGTEPA
jgi:AcrR family transcriptional regulator